MSPSRPEDPDHALARRDPDEALRTAAVFRLGADGVPLDVADLWIRLWVNTTTMDPADRGYWDAAYRWVTSERAKRPRVRRHHRHALPGRLHE